MADKASLARAGTMQNTAKEGTSFLDRNLTEWKKPHLMDDYEPPKKTPKLSKHTTMKETAQEAKNLLAGEKLSDTRQETKIKQSATKKGKKRSRADGITDEAKAVYSDLDTSGPRKLRKRKAAAPKPAKAPKTKAVKKSKASPKKPAMKKAGTMVATAKEGRNLLKISKKTKYFTK